MFKRTDMNAPSDRFHQVKIDLDTDNFRDQIQAVVYPNYSERLIVKINSAGIGFEITRDQTRDLIEVLQAALRACE